MTTLTYLPTYGAAGDYEPKVFTSKFGEGYQQRLGDGVHPMARKWSLEFADRSLSEASAIEAFFLAANGLLSFTWVPPSGASGQWVCPKWRLVAAGYNNWSVSAELEEVFE